jgi:hypothetical protein
VTARAAGPGASWARSMRAPRAPARGRAIYERVHVMGAEARARTSSDALAGASSAGIGNAVARAGDTGDVSSRRAAGGIAVKAEARGVASSIAAGWVGEDGALTGGVSAGADADEGAETRGPSRTRFTGTGGAAESMLGDDDSDGLPLLKGRWTGRAREAVGGDDVRMAPSSARSSVAHTRVRPGRPGTHSASRSAVPSPLRLP